MNWNSRESIVSLWLHFAKELLRELNHSIKIYLSTDTERTQQFHGYAIRRIILGLECMK